MTTEQREAIRQCELYVQAEATIQLVDEIDGKLAFKSCDTSAIDTVLSLIKQLETEKEIHVGLEHQYKKEYLDMLDLTKKYSAELLQKNAEKNAEIEKKDKIINLMIDEFYKKAKISTRCYLQKSVEECMKYKNCKECLKQYFENKVNSKIQ